MDKGVMMKKLLKTSISTLLCVSASFALATSTEYERPPTPTPVGGGSGTGTGIGTGTANATNGPINTSAQGGVGTGTGTGTATASNGPIDVSAKGGSGTGTGTGTATTGPISVTTQGGSGTGTASTGPINVTTQGGGGGTGTGTGTATSDASAAAKAASDAAATAANWSSMTSAQKSELLASLTSEQRQALQVALNNRQSNSNKLNISTPSSATAAGGTSGANASTGPVDAGGGGANVSTHNESNILQVNLPSVPAVAPTAVAQNGGIIMSGKCGARKEVETIPIEYLLVGHIGMDKVQLSGQTTERLIPAKDGKEFITVDNGDGTKSEIGTIATTAIMTVSGSVSKQFGFGLVGSQGGGSVSNGVAGTISITQRFITTGDCVFRSWKEVRVQAPVAPSVTTSAAPVSKIETEKVKTFTRIPYACWYGDPATKPERTAKGTPVRQCSQPKGLIEGSHVVPLVGEEVEVLVHK